MASRRTATRSLQVNEKPRMEVQPRGDVAHEFGGRDNRGLCYSIDHSRGEDQRMTFLRYPVWNHSGAALILTAITVGGCAAPIHAPAGRRLAVPFVPQGADRDCAVASLTILLRASGHEVDSARLQTLWTRPWGTLPVTVESWLRSHAIPFDRLSPGETDIRRRIDQGRPVMVLWNRSQGPLRNFHYAVVAGYETDSQGVVRAWLVHDGRRAYRRVDRVRFHAWWSRAGFWGLTLVSPDGENR